MANAWCVPGFLQIHPEINQIDQNLHVTLRLHGTTHHPETQPGLTILGYKGGNNGVKGAFVRGVGIKMPFFQGKELSTILQDEAQIVRHHARAHTAVIALNQRYHVPFFIRHG